MTFRAELERRVGALSDAVAAQLEAELASVRARWPHGPAPGEALALLVARQIAPHDADRMPRVEDLYLAWWCGTGDPAAIAAFDARFDGDLRAATARFRDVAADELRQQLRIKLFVGTPESPPKILDYAGKGSLQSWLRVTAVRCFVDITRSSRSRHYEQELDEHELLGIGDPERAAIGSALGAAVKAAFAAAVAELTPRQRVFLRHAYVDHHTLDQIAAHYSVHRATVARTLATAREQLIARTRAGVAASLGVGDAELASAIQALDSRLDLSLSRILEKPAGPWRF